MKPAVRSASISAKDETLVDLGDDLLQTRTLQRSDARASLDSQSEAKLPRTPSEEENLDVSLDELLLNAKILMGEGLYEDAKRTLRKVMKRDPGSLAARDRMEEIRRVELKKLLGDDDSPRVSYRKAKKLPSEQDEAAQAMADLERELGPSKSAEEEYFKSPEERAVFVEMVDRLCAGASGQDRIDLGIGFLEMGFYEVSIRLFEAGTRDADVERKARGLLAIAYLETGRAFDAMIELETLIAHQDAKPEEKIDFGYLAGKAQEALGHFPAAAHWYRAVHQIDPQYRDVVDRIKFCLKKCASTPSLSS